MKRVKTFLIWLAVLLASFCTFAQAREILEMKQLPKTQPVTIDGYGDESAWENSVFIKKNLPGRNSTSKYVILQLLGDINNLYFQAYVMDDDRAVVNGLPDGIRLKLTQSGSGGQYFVGCNGTAKPQISSAANDYGTYYLVEGKIPFAKQWKSSGEFSLELSVIDNGVDSAEAAVSEVSTFSYLFRVNMESATTSSTVQATTTAPSSTTKPSTVTTTKSTKTTTQPTKTSVAATTKKAKPVSPPSSQRKTQASHPANSEGSGNNAIFYEEETASVSVPNPNGEAVTGAAEQPGTIDPTAAVALLQNNAETTQLQTNQKATGAARVFGTIVAGMLLFGGVFLLLRLRKVNNSEDKK